MKFYILLAICLVSLSTAHKKSKDIFAETDNFGLTPPHGAYAYNKAMPGPNNMPFEASKGLFRPEVVPKLPEYVPPPRRGPLEITDELPSSKFYYDGSAKLNKVVINCRIYANPTDCVSRNNCGWCGNANGCIFGNNMGPLEPCAKSSFIFSAPYPNWNPVANTVDEHMGNLSMTVLAK